MKVSSLAIVALTIMALQSAVLAITKVSLVDHSDPNYTDRCLEITGELCDYCCMVDFEWCSRDIYNCMPVRDRNLGALWNCVIVLGAVILGFPLIGCILYRCLMIRFFNSCFQSTSGISTFECLCRGLHFTLCCGRRFSQTY